MPTPRDPVPRRFYRAALQRLADGQVLMLTRPAAAIYLSGYAIECVLKALVLCSVTTQQQAGFARDHFRGQRAHEIDWLRRLLHQQKVPGFPSEILDDLVFVSTWAVDLRYNPNVGNVDDAVDFVAAAERIVEFVEQRLI